MGARGGTTEPATERGVFIRTEQRRGNDHLGARSSSAPQPARPGGSGIREPGPAAAPRHARLLLLSVETGGADAHLRLQVFSRHVINQAD